MKIAAVQMTSGVDVAANLAHVREAVAHAAGAGAQLIALPENFAFMGQRERDKLAIAEPHGDGPIQSAIAELAAQHRVWIVAGTLPLRSPPDAAGSERARAACLVFNAAGQQVARYDKMHLFDVDVPGKEESHRESNSIAPGDAPQVVETPVGRLGLAVCYDVRFPELFRAMSRSGLDGFVLPSAFTVPTGRAHWELLLRARAVENQCWALAPAQSGFHANGRETFGDSMIVDHWGRVLARRPRGTGVVLAEIDVAAQNAARVSFPALQHRRLDISDADD